MRDAGDFILVPVDKNDVGEMAGCVTIKLTPFRQALRIKSGKAVVVVYSEKRKRKNTSALSGAGILAGGAAFIWRNLIVRPTRWAWRQFTLASRFTLNAAVWLTVWAGRGMWRASVWTVRAPFRAVGWAYRTFVRGTPEPDEPFAAIRWRIARRFRRRNRFLTHLFAFLAVNFAALIDFMMNSPRYHSYTPRSFIGSYVVPMAIWATLLIFHFARMKLAEAEDNAVQTVLERQSNWQTPYLVEDEYADDTERYTRLSDDAETKRPINDAYAHEKRKRRA